VSFPQIVLDLPSVANLEIVGHSFVKLIEFLGFCLLVNSNIVKLAGFFWLLLLYKILVGDLFFSYLAFLG
jgi:hypothetical protein